MNDLYSISDIAGGATGPPRGLLRIASKFNAEIDAIT
jgi:hypothetical protein